MAWIHQTYLEREKKKKADFLFNSTSEKLGRYAFGGSVDCQLVKAIAHIALGDWKKKELRNDLKNLKSHRDKNSFFIQSN